MTEIKEQEVFARIGMQALEIEALRRENEALRDQLREVVGKLHTAEQTKNGKAETSG
jgi:hypothetical protein